MQKKESYNRKGKVIASLLCKFPIQLATGINLDLIIE